MSAHALLISIRPRFAKMIFSGAKTVELRRVRPRVATGDLALVYVSAPSMAIQGAFEVDEVISDSPMLLWKKIGGESGLNREEFLAYFEGKQTAHAIKIARAWRLKAPVGLRQLRRHTKNFRPPQSFRYARDMTFPAVLR